MSDPPMAELIALRRELHRIPEPAGRETRTAARIRAFLATCRPTRVIHPIAGCGLACIFEGHEPGPTIGFRCELDALPIEERNQIPWRSELTGLSHKCGHDGHMAIVAGLAGLARESRPGRGRLVLIYQPAEETGTGGPAYCEDPAFATLALDRVYALHNLPTYPLGTVVVRNGCFCCASRGMCIRLTGRTAHAAHPENGRSPAAAMCRIIAGLAALPNTIADAFTLVTVVGAKLGEAAFGTAPGDAEIYATLRGDADEAMRRLVTAAEALVARAAGTEGLKHEIDWRDIFTVTENHTEPTEAVRRAARDSGRPIVERTEALRFSEDFGAFTARVPGALFGLGSGPGPDLHNDDYDFPDTLIPIGTRLFYQLAREPLDWRIG